MICSTCRFAKADTTKEAFFCQRFPPVMVEGVASDSNDDGMLNSVYSITYSLWPEVRFDDWCGEYKDIGEKP